MTGSLWRHKDHVDAFRWIDIAVTDVEAVAEKQGIPWIQMGQYVIDVQRALDCIGCLNRNQGRLGRSACRRNDPEPRIFSFGP